MRKLAALLFGIFALHALDGFGQSPADMLKGTWVAESRYCGKSIYKIDRVDDKGTVYGSFTCLNTKWTPTLGDKVGKDAVKGTLTGTRFVMVNADGGGSDLILNGTKLEGTGAVKSDSPRSPVTYLKQ